MRSLFISFGLGRISIQAEVVAVEFSPQLSVLIVVLVVLEYRIPPRNLRGRCSLKKPSKRAWV